VELDTEVGKEEYMLAAVEEEEDQNDPKPRSEDVVDCCGRYSGAAVKKRVSGSSRKD
jgi:hypothetical protein